LYTAADRAKMSVEMTEEVRRQVGARGIIVEETPLKTIVLPKRLTDAIEDKLAAEQESQRMVYYLHHYKLGSSHTLF
jgi:prohibitin 1